MTATRLRRRASGGHLWLPRPLGLAPYRLGPPGVIWLVVDLLVGPLPLPLRWWGIHDPSAVLGG